MEYRGIKRVGGKGYENQYLVVKKGRKSKGDYAFFFFLALFGGAVYLIASTIFRSLFLSPVPASILLY